VKPGNHRPPSESGNIAKRAIFMLIARAQLDKIPVFATQDSLPR